MATIDSLSKDYTEYLIINKNDPDVISNLEKKINKLIYTETEKSITNQDKLEIIEQMERNVSSNAIEVTENRYLLRESDNSQELINLINELKKRLK